MKLIFDPSKGKGNRYIDVLVNGLKNKGYEVHSLKQLFKSIHLLLTVRIVHLNWFDNLNTKWDFVKRIFKLSLLLATGKKIVWTMHNRVPHNAAVSQLSKLLIKLLLTVSSRIVIHCKSSEAVVASYSKGALKKVVYIPHPNYIGEYGFVQEKSFQQDKNVLELLFVGAVKPYKNIEMLIEVMENLANPSIRLTIAGKPHTATYKDQLMKRLQAVSSVSAQLRFIEDEELVGMMQASDLIVLPYDLRSSLNSGTVLLAFSYGKTVICPAIGTLLDYEEENFLMYNYTTQEEHRKALQQTISKAFELYTLDKDIFDRWGKNMLTKVSTYNNKEEIVDQYDRMYHSI